MGHFHKGTSRFPPLLSVPALHVLLLCPKSPHREDDIGLTKPPSGHCQLIQLYRSLPAPSNIS